MNNGRDCEHGQLARSCDLCADAAEIAELRKANEALLAALKSTGLFLHHCWCNVPMNEHSFELLSKQMEVVDAAINRELALHNA